MRLAKAFCFGAWLVVVINLLMAFGAIGIFTRMTPAIAEIISNNERSLKACEEMLVAMVMGTSKIGDTDSHQYDFKAALVRAKKNVTEGKEPEAIAIINSHYEAAFNGSEEAVKISTTAILQLSSINRDAMAEADRHAQQLGNGGAWGIVFMAIFSFIIGIVFIRQMNNKLLIPLEEIKTVLLEHQAGEMRRRCTGINLPSDIRSIFSIINQLLDRASHSLNNR